MNKTFAVIVVVLSLLVVILFTMNSRHKGPETVYIPDKLIRLHVVANSDSVDDQVLKLKIRDAIVHDVAPTFLGAENIDSARAIARGNLSHVKEIASREIQAEGKNYPVNVELDSFTFPTKHYGTFVLPAGDYEAVRVVIGAGGGANWWCVLFPPLCFVDMSKGVAISQPEKDYLIPPTPLQNAAVSEEQPPVVAVQQKSGDLTGGSDAAVPEETLTRVEFRFRILDFFKNL